MDSNERRRRDSRQEPGRTRRRKTPSQPERTRPPRRRTAPRRKDPDAEIVYTPSAPFNRGRFALRLATVVAVVLALLFGMSIFFKVANVTVSGNQKYSAWDISQAAGIQEGENLLTLSKARVSGNIISQLPYVKSVRIGIKLPDTVNIEITERAAILAELGFVYGTEEEENQKETEPAKKKPTLSDVHGEGNYRVWIGDSMWWNYYYFYFEDGKLVKIECFFQKSDGEPVEEYVFEGDTLDDFWYIDMSIEELIQYFEDNGYGYDYSVSRTD